MLEALLAAVALTALPCEVPQGAEFSDAQSQTYCQLARSKVAPEPLDRAALSRILVRPEFAHVEDDPYEGLLKWLENALRSLFDSLNVKAGRSFSELTRVAVLFAAAVVASLALASFVLRWRWKKRGPVSKSEPSSNALALESPQAHLDRARTLLSHSPREALREGLLSLLSSLEAARLARPERVKTNRELADEMTARGASEALARRARELFSTYDGHWYSLTAVSSSTVESFLGAVESLQSSIREASA